MESSFKMNKSYFFSVAGLSVLISLATIFLFFGPIDNMSATSNVIASNVVFENTTEEINKSEPFVFELPNNHSVEYICGYSFYKCKYFQTHQQAQEVYDFCGGKGDDIHGLDFDNDGIACESLIE